VDGGGGGADLTEDDIPFGRSRRRDRWPCRC